ncbi:uncharacterized protein B0H18DRAFT_1116294 [Fomitopsis serialis]|uniref:uncharacterized protein n=1 Tax=Fomitopsis serialis TaxID=139415 RepID=UPI002008D3B6|nr:uncharacterized protein B0H18DRAFT_1116294 [Neoantrodia serialis]KAH9931494.1 hypothetical protein B0H18DRAFT_1116294 [Neoantrodia serialis]
MTTPDAKLYQYDGTCAFEPEQAKAKLVEGGLLMDKYIAQVKADMGAVVIDKDSVKKLSRPELESLAISLQKTNAAQARDLDFAFRVFFQLLYETRHTTTGKSDI